MLIKGKSPERLHEAGGGDENLHGTRENKRRAQTTRD